jgi:MSHA pilin protein MshD
MIRLYNVACRLLGLERGLIFRQASKGLRVSHVGLPGKNQGLTYIELVIGIIIIGIALAGVIKAMNAALLGVSDPAQRVQAISIANSYMEEILAKSYLDPTSGTACPSAPSSRNLYDNVCDYNGLHDVGAHDQDGNSISGLEGYTIDVTVTQGVTQAYSALPTNLVSNHADTTAPTMEVDVVVSYGYGGNEQAALTGYKVNY